MASIPATTNQSSSKTIAGLAEAVRGQAPGGATRLARIVNGNVAQAASNGGLIDSPEQETPKASDVAQLSSSNIGIGDNLDLLA
jgi:hypothetical protein